MHSGGQEAGGGGDFAQSFRAFVFYGLAGAGGDFATPPNSPGPVLLILAIVCVHIGASPVCRRSKPEKMLIGSGSLLELPAHQVFT
jgi:hypothetical protein